MEERTHKQALPTGYLLQNHRVVSVLGVGGFGVTYLAEHVTLGQKAAIKEYLPNEFALREGATVHPKSETDREDFEWGLSRFLDEARTLARFEHRNVVRVRDYFEANNTAYIVMDYEEGEPLDRLLERHGTLTEAQLNRVLLPIIKGLGEVHAAGFLHRDTKPSNVFVRRSDESPVLLDFGAARQALGRKSKSLTAVASAGYSPPEQYESEGEQGPWTDIYALSALCYRAITGSAPTEAPRRQSRLARRQPDPVPRLADSLPDGYSKALLEAVDWGLRVIETERPQSLDAWAAVLSGASMSRTTPGEPQALEDTQGAPDMDRPAAPGRGRGRAGAWIAIAAGLAIAAVAAVWWLTLEPGIELLSPADLATQSVESTPAPVEPQPRRETSPMSVVTGGTSILVVETEPSGVEVLLGDEPTGKTPLQLMTVRAGTHSVTLRHADYENARLDDQSFADGRVVRISQTMVRATGAMTVITEPAEVWVERDGKRLAERTPVTLEGLPAGTLELTLGAEQHRPIRVEVHVPKDGVGMLERTLERIPYGTLTLDLDPPDATVTLPDIAPAYRAGIRLAEGSHRVIVARKGYRQVARTVEVSGDTVERVELAVDPQPFTVVTTPADAVVQFLNVEDDYRDGMVLNPGEYRIRVSASEYEMLERTVSHGVEATIYSVELSRRPQPFTVVVTPAAATVSILGLSEEYVAGIRLPPGEYRIQIAAEGYEVLEKSVRHGINPTRIALEMERSLPQPGESFADALATGGTGPEMVVIPAGSFRMGCLSNDDDCQDDETPVHDAWIPEPFALSKYEVTFADWDACVSEGGCKGYRPNDRGRGRGSRPVINVSWEDSQAYVSWLSDETGVVYRLPSETEWEYAARAGTTTKYSWGNRIGHNRANCDGCGSRWDDDRAAPVGAFAPNAFGLNDMHGNVWEWVEDCWNDSYHGAPADGDAWKSGDCGRYVLRGGSWVNDPRSLRSGNRQGYPSSLRNIYNKFGFRVARTLTLPGTIPRGRDSMN